MGMAPYAPSLLSFLTVVVFWGGGHSSSFGMMVVGLRWAFLRRQIHHLPARTCDWTTLVPPPPTRGLRWELPLCILLLSINNCLTRFFLLLPCFFASSLSLAAFILFSSYLTTMPKQITDIRDFLQKARRKDAKQVKIRKRADSTKFKIRCSKYLYTLSVEDAEKAEKLTQSLPPGLKRVDI